MDQLDDVLDGRRRSSCWPSPSRPRPIGVIDRRRLELLAPHALGGERRPGRAHRHRRPRRRRSPRSGSAARPSTSPTRSRCLRGIPCGRSPAASSRRTRPTRWRWPYRSSAAGCGRTCDDASPANRCSARSTSTPGTDRARSARRTRGVGSAPWTSAKRPSPPSPTTSAARRISARELVQAALDRIEADRPEGERVRGRRRRVRAGGGRRPSTRRIAAGEAVGPLAGIPIGVKDLEDAIGFVTTQGSVVLRRRAAGHGRLARSWIGCGRRVRRRGQDQHARARPQGRHHQPAVRLHPQPVGPRPHRRRLVRRLGRGARGRPRAALHGLRRRRIDPDPVVGVRALRA